MKHIINFLSYLKESKDISDNELKQLLLPFSDNNIKYEINKIKK